MSATTSLHPKSLPPFFTTTTPPSFPPNQITNLSFFHNSQSFSTNKFRTNAKKKNPWLDPFDQGDDPEMEYGSQFSDGLQEEDSRPPDNPGNPYGFLKFPQGFTVEVASFGLKIRGDVRRCCCVVSGGVYENLLFFLPLLYNSDIIFFYKVAIFLDFFIWVVGVAQILHLEREEFLNFYDLSPSPAGFLNVFLKWRKKVDDFGYFLGLILKFASHW